MSFDKIFELAAGVYFNFYNTGECNLYANILFCFNQLSAGRPGGLLVVLPSNTTNVFGFP